jgi:hypothetical protein
MSCCILQNSRDVFVRLLDRRGQLPRSCFPILEQLSEPGVNRGATERIGGSVGPGCEERVREANAIALELDHAGFEGRRQALATWDSCRCLGDRNRRMRVRGRR